nr:rRNA maturation RNase YbeY [Lachnospiraceae bacterium]
MTLEYSCEEPLSFDFDPKEVAKEVIQAVLSYEGFTNDVEVSLTLVSEEEIQKLNKEFRDKDAVTDVLSFPMLELEGVKDFSELEIRDDMLDPDTEDILLGDIVICVSRVRSQAKEYGHSEKREYAFLIAHSMLHLLGYDHMEEIERQEMEDK